MFEPTPCLHLEGLPGSPKLALPGALLKPHRIRIHDRFSKVPDSFENHVLGHVLDVFAHLGFENVSLVFLKVDPRLLLVLCGACSMVEGTDESRRIRRVSSPSLASGSRLVPACWVVFFLFVCLGVPQVEAWGACASCNGLATTAVVCVSRATEPCPLPPSLCCTTAHTSLLLRSAASASADVRQSVRFPDLRHPERRQRLSRQRASQLSQYSGLRLLLRSGLHHIRRLLLQLLRRLQKTGHQQSEPEPRHHRRRHFYFSDRRQLWHVQRRQQLSAVQWRHNDVHELERQSDCVHRSGRLRRAQNRAGAKLLGVCGARYVMCLSLTSHYVSCGAL
jgi:hypothetical protein